MAEKDSNLDQNPSNQQTDPALRQKAGQVVSLVSLYYSAIQAFQSVRGNLECYCKLKDKLDLKTIR